MDPAHHEREVTPCMQTHLLLHYLVFKREPLDSFRVGSLLPPLPNLLHLLLLAPNGLTDKATVSLTTIPTSFLTFALLCFVAGVCLLTTPFDFVDFVDLLVAGFLALGVCLEGGCANTQIVAARC